MANNQLNILFWLYKSKCNKEGNAPLYLRVSYANQRRNLSTGFSIPAVKWDAKKVSLKGPGPHSQQVNSYISDTRSRLTKLFYEMLPEKNFSLERLVDRFLNKATDRRTLLQLVNYHNEDFKSRIGIDFTFSTFEKYDILRRKLELFMPHHYRKKDIPLKDLTVQFMADFDFYLKTHDHNEHNTATKYLKNLKKILNVGVLNGWVEENPFVRFKSSYKDVDRVYLTQQELDAILAKHFVLPRLSLVKDLFLFQCYTGLAYTDMAKLTRANISPGIDGTKWIIIRRQKTDVRAAIPLLEQAEQIIIKYPKDEQSNQPLLPCYAIQRFNTYLHEIAELCGIHKNLTSHVGRRTFATSIALANGISLETISKMLGHSSTKITAQYAVVTDHKISQEMNDLRARLQMKQKRQE